MRRTTGIQNAAPNSWARTIQTMRREGTPTMRAGTAIAPRVPRPPEPVSDDPGVSVVEPAPPGRAGPLSGPDAAAGDSVGGAPADRPGLGLAVGDSVGRESLVGRALGKRLGVAERTRLGSELGTRLGSRPIVGSGPIVGRGSIVVSGRSVGGGEASGRLGNGRITASAGAAARNGMRAMAAPATIRDPRLGRP